MGIAIVLFIRLLVPFSIRRWPFWGGIAAIVADGIDLHILNRFGWPYANGIEYQSLDKLLDLYYLAFEFVLVLQFKDLLIKRTLGALFVWRAIGVAIFEITHLRYVLFFAPNIFEYVFLALMATRKQVAQGRWKERQIFIGALIIFTPLKLAHEYVMHVIEYPLGLGRMWDLFSAWWEGL